MSQAYDEPSPTAHRDLSNDDWWRKSLDMAASALQFKAYESTGKDVAWSDAVMQVSAGASWGWQIGRQFTDFPKAPVGDVAAGFSERLAEEYMGQERIPNLIDTHESLPNVRAYMIRAEPDQTLQKAATSIVQSADLTPDGRRQMHPDPEKVSEVRNAMSQALLDGRFNGPVAAGVGTSPEGAEQNFGWRLGYEAADAGVRKMNELLTEGGDRELARTVERGLGAQAAPRPTAPAERTDGAAAGTSTSAATQKNAGIGPRS